MNGTNSNVDRSGLWLVRPDGYEALPTRHDQWDEIARYIEVLTKGAR
jgi:hypothetical protein